MGWEKTITEQDMDVASQQFAQAFRKEGSRVESDLAVDGLSESILSRLLGIFRPGKS